MYVPLGWGGEDLSDLFPWAYHFESFAANALNGKLECLGVPTLDRDAVNIEILRLNGPQDELLPLFNQNPELANSVASIDLDREGLFESLVTKKAHEGNRARHF